MFPMPYPGLSTLAGITRCQHNWPTWYPLIPHVVTQVGIEPCSLAKAGGVARGAAVRRRIRIASFVHTFFGHAVVTILTPSLTEYLHFVAVRVKHTFLLRDRSPTVWASSSRSGEPCSPLVDCGGTFMISCVDRSGERWLLHEVSLIGGCKSSSCSRFVLASMSHSMLQFVWC